MKTLTTAAATTLLAATLTACGKAEPTEPKPSTPPPTPISQRVITLPDNRPRPPFQFSDTDEQLLDEIQRATFRFLWEDVSPDNGMVLDRSGGNTVSVAGVGFQLTALAIAAERNFIPRDDAQSRALRILRALEANPDNRKAGLFYHFLDPATAGPTTSGYETVVSTIDTALLFAGVITASTYFKNDVADVADRLIADADWAFFVSGEEARPFERGFISLGWQPDDVNDPTGEGALLPFYWVDSGDEHLLVNFLAVAAPNPDHRPDPTIYYRLRRRLGQYEDVGPFVWFPWSGALFTNVFAHCWIHYAAMGPDNPAAHNVERRPRVDWWANSAMAVEMHRLKAIDNPHDLPTLGPNAWGLSACDSADGYLVPALFPEPLPMPGCVPNYDYAAYLPEENWGDGTVPPYGAGMAILFDPTNALAALHHYRTLETDAGQPLVWTPNHGFRDSFNLGTRWVAPDHVAIDQGALLLAIENARSGLVWDLFHAHPGVEAAMDRLGLSRVR